MLDTIGTGHFAAHTGPLVVLMAAATVDSQCYMIAQPVRQSDGAPFLLLEESGSSWNDSVAQSLQRSFGLTPREIAVIEGICDGKSLSQIAENVSRQVATLRMQMKSILR